MNINLPTLQVYLYYLVKIALYVFVVVILVKLFGKEAASVLKRLRRKSVFREGKKNHNKLFVHIDKIYYALYGNNDNRRIYNFFIISIALFIIPLFLLRNTINPFFSLLISLGLFITPYVYLRLNLYKTRVESSFDADKVVTEIANQYKICGFNMREAIRRSERFLESAPYSRKHIYSLALGLDTYKTDEELIKYLGYFTFGINTQWAKMLANNIYFAVSKDFNVVEGLSDILKDIKNSYEAAENAKRENSESFLMVFYVAPVLLIISPFLASRLLGFPYSKFIKYQLNTPVGMTLIIMILLSLFFNYFIMYFLKRKKFDI